MKTVIQGEKYNFEIWTERGRRHSTFSIRAISKDTGKYSSINNLNTILATLGVDSDHPKFADSLWVVTNKEAVKFEELIKSDLDSPFFRHYLEAKLDEDRMEGEWANSLPDSSETGEQYDLRNS